MVIVFVFPFFIRTTLSVTSAPLSYHRLAFESTGSSVSGSVVAVSPALWMSSPLIARPFTVRPENHFDTMSRTDECEATSLGEHTASPRHPDTNLVPRYFSCSRSSLKKIQVLCRKLDFFFRPAQLLPTQELHLVHFHVNKFRNMMKKWEKKKADWISVLKFVYELALQPHRLTLECNTGRIAGLLNRALVSNYPISFLRIFISIYLIFVSDLIACQELRYQILRISSLINRLLCLCVVFFFRFVRCRCCEMLCANT